MDRAALNRDIVARKMFTESYQQLSGVPAIPRGRMEKSDTWSDQMAVLMSSSYGRGDGTPWKGRDFNFGKGRLRDTPVRFTPSP